MYTIITYINGINKPPIKSVKSTYKEYESMASKKLYQVRKIRDLKDMLEQSCSLFGDKSAFLIREKENQFREISYRQLGNDVDAIGTALLDLGLENKMIAVFGENRYEWAVTYLSVVNGVGTIVPLDKELPADEIVNLLNRCGASAIVFSGKYRNQMKKLAGTIPSIQYYIDMDLVGDEDGLKSFNGLLNKGKELKIAGDDRFSKAVIDPDAMRMLIFTSGTTDLAKGVMLSHKNICANLTSVFATVYVDTKDVSLSILPMHHTYECSLGFLGFIYSGGAIAFNEGLKYIQRNLQEVRPTMLVTVPLLLENVHRKIIDKIGKSRLGMFKFEAALIITNLLNDAFRIDIRKKVFKAVHDTLGGRMRLVITGAAAIKPEVSRCFRRMGISVLQGYGLTECAPLVTGNRDKSFVDKSAGLPIPGVTVRIIDPDANGIGEIVTKGDNVMLGYYNNKEATDKCLHDGWFHTGDLGYLDKRGFLYITGRIKNVIVTKNGKKIFPEEVEAYINRSPFVQDSLVWGKYDESSGETIVCAQVLPNLDAISEKIKEMASNKDELLKAINDAINEAVRNANKDMPLYKRIREFTIREKEFVKTTTQKIKRYIETPSVKALM